MQENKSEPSQSSKIGKTQQKRRKTGSSAQPSTSAQQSPQQTVAEMKPCELCPICCEELGSSSRRFKKQAKVICPHCSYKSCMSCNQRYLLESIAAPHCMNCRNRWTYKDLLKLLTVKFTNVTYRKQRGSYLLDRAKSNIPLASSFVAAEKRLADVMREKQGIYNEIHHLQSRDTDKKFNSEQIKRLKAEDQRLSVESAALILQTFKQRQRNGRNQKYTQEFIDPCPVDGCRGYIAKSTQKCGICNIFVCRKCARVLNHNSNQLTFVSASAAGSPDDYAPPPPPTSISTLDEISAPPPTKPTLDEIPAPPPPLEPGVFSNAAAPRIDLTVEDSDDAHPAAGFDEDDISASLSPFEKKELTRLKKNHTCKQEDVDSVKEIRKHSQQCPSCKIRIFKIAGCDTMWCTNCNNGFNYRTGMIIKDVRQLHNPHYAEFIRQNPNFRYGSGREEKADHKAPHNPCDVMTLETFVPYEFGRVQRKFVDLRRVHFLLNREQVVNSVNEVKYQQIICDFQQLMGHIQDYALRKFIQGNQYDAVEYAYKFVTSKLDEKRWRIQIEHHDRFQQTNREYADVIQLWLVVLHDLFTNYLMSESKYALNDEDMIKFITEMMNMTNYTNRLISEMNETYKRKTNLINMPQQAKDLKFPGIQSTSISISKFNGLHQMDGGDNHYNTYPRFQREVVHRTNRRRRQELDNDIEIEIEAVEDLGELRRMNQRS